MIHTLRRGRWPTVLLALLAILTLVVMDGIHAALWLPGTDLSERIQGFWLFRNGHYPHHRLVPRPLPPGFRTTPYPPWALPMFGLFVGWWQAAACCWLSLPWPSPGRDRRA